MNKYKIIDIMVVERHFLKAINQGLKPNVMEVTLKLEKTKTLFWFFKYHIKHKVEGIIAKDVNIYDYVKIGDEIDLDDYPMLKPN